MCFAKLFNFSAKDIIFNGHINNMSRILNHYKKSNIFNAFRKIIMVALLKKKDSKSIK
jgi:hypothetical protein